MSRDFPQEEVYSKKIKAGKRTYIFDVRPTRGRDYFITLTERKQLPDGDVHKSKIFLYKEDFQKFLVGLQEVIEHVKTELLNGEEIVPREDLPYNREENGSEGGGGYRPRNDRGGERNYNRDGQHRRNDQYD